MQAMNQKKWNATLKVKVGYLQREICRSLLEVVMQRSRLLLP
jgi:hypothetical protein